MIKKISVLACFVTLALSSCLEVNTSSEGTQYFDLSKVIHQNIDTLLMNNYSVLKYALLDSKADTTTYQPDSLDWLNEMGLFLDADISKPQSKGLFSVVDTNDDNSNLNIRTYAHKGEYSNVKSFKVYYFDELSNVVKIEIEFLDESAGIILQRKMKLNFQSKGRFQIIDSWEIQGSQDVLGIDQLTYEIHGKVVQ